MLKIAFRGVFRYKKRTTITAFAISIAIIFSIFMQTLLSGMHLDSNKNLVWNDTSSAKIYSTGYFSNKEYLPIDNLIPYETGVKLQSILENNDFKDYTKEFISFSQIMFYEDPFPTTGSLTTQLKAIDSSHSNAYNFSDATVEGQWLSRGVEGAVLGAKLADDIGAKVGYFITVQTKGKGGFIQAFDIPIIGIITTNDPVVDSNTIFFDLKTIDYYLELDGSATSYAVSYTMNIPKLEAITEDKTEVLSSLVNPLELEAYSWREVEKEIADLLAAETSATYLFLFFTFVIAIVGISNTMLMTISERQKEIGMLKALGYNNNYIKALFTLEGAIIGFIGVVIGSIIGLLLSLYFQIAGLDFSLFFSDTDSIGYRINAVIHTFISLPDILLIAFFGIAVSVFSAYIAVRKIGKGKISLLLKQ